jgi:hypothetical protein
MKKLIGRRVHMIYGATYPVLEGVVYTDQPEGCYVRFEDGTRQFFAKFRLLTSEYTECTRPNAVGVYMIQEEI